MFSAGLQYLFLERTAYSDLFLHFVDQKNVSAVLSALRAGCCNGGSNLTRLLVIAQVSHAGLKCFSKNGADHQEIFYE